jgi:hypothetical protein
MEIALALIVVSIAGLIAQWRSQQHEHAMTYGEGLLHRVEQRVSELERRKAQDFNRAEFEELKSKVEALRIGQGLKR